MSRTSSFPWYYYIRSARSRIFFSITSIILTYLITEFYSHNAIPKIITLIVGVILSSFFVSYFRIIPLRKILDRMEKIQTKLPQDKKINIIYQRNEWDLLDEMLLLTEHYIGKQNEIVQTQTEQSNIILNSIPDAMVTIDNSRKIKRFNTVFKENFLVDDNKKKEIELSSVLNNESLISLFRKCLQKNKKIRTSGFFIETRNEFYDIAIAPTHNQQNEVNGALAIFHNVTEAQLSERMRVDFVANVSHEIRTPLTSIKGYAQLLQAHGDGIPKEFHPILDKIDINAERLKDLFDNLLKLSLIESRYALTLEDTDLSFMISQIESNLKAKHLKKKIKIKCDLENEFIKCDVKLMEQVLNNLIDNAIKYGPKDIKIKIKSKKQDNANLIIVTDNGPGISEKELNRIFERFYRVQGTSKKNIEGSGLGLSIVKHIINKHKGEISVNSTLDEGTEFIIKLPI